MKDNIKDKPKSFGRTGFIYLALSLITAWVVIFSMVDEPLTLIADYWHFFLLGIVGALAANSTGAGGGIVFIPAFTSLGINEAEALGTSIAIQCFGMTAGSISWLLSIYGNPANGKAVRTLTKKLLFYSGIAAISGMLCGQYLLPSLANQVLLIFKYFSILFGALLLLITLRRTANRHTHYHLRKRDIPLILGSCFIGGLVTSWISVGVGEFIALLLFILGYPTMISVCIAVCVSSLSVLSGVPYHLFVANTVVWQILVFAAPAAIIGGTLARYLAIRLGATRLKIFFATWILATGFAM